LLDEPEVNVFERLALRREFMDVEATFDEK
jgi:hypothetical protein